MGLPLRDPVGKSASARILWRHSTVYYTRTHSANRSAKLGIDIDNTLWYNSCIKEVPDYLGLPTTRHCSRSAVTQVQKVGAASANILTVYSLV